MGARHNPYFRKLLVGFEVAMELAECLDAEVVVFAVAQLPKPATMVEVRRSWTMLVNTTRQFSKSL